MKKRTACFGWTKVFQRRVAHGYEVMRTGHHDLAKKISADVKRDQIARVKQLRGVA